MPTHTRRKQQNGKYVYTKYRTSAKYKRKPPRSRRSYHSKLSDKKVNTLVELRMEEIAKKEIEKKRALLTSRKYLFCRYDINTNEFVSLMNGQLDTSHMDWTGKVVELSNIPQVDIEFLQNAPQVDDPNTGNNENVDNDGVGQGSPIKNANGRRTSNQIFIQSVSADLRLRFQKLLNNDTETDEYGSCLVSYAFVLWRDEESIINDPTEKPDANELLNTGPFSGFGYSGKIDLSLEQKYHGLKTRVLCAGSTSLKMNNDYTSEKFTTIFKKFKNPIKIQYVLDDQNGQECNQKIYFVCRCTLPDSVAENVKPSVMACTKLNYYEA